MRGSSSAKAPSRYAIAAYWAREENASRATFVVDLSEPSCFGCNYFAHEWDRARTFAARWNGAALERAHVVARTAGGDAAPGNFVLLCATCHRAAPMTTREGDMFAWLERRPSHWQCAAGALTGELAALGIDPRALAPLPDNPARLFALFEAAAARIGAGMHWGEHGARFSDATRALITRAALAATTKGVKP